jgi:RNase P subunit RPR2
MSKNKEQIAKEQVEYFNRVKEYVRMEYSDEMAAKMSVLKYFKITLPYCKNCYSLKRPIPYTANEIVRFLNKTE